MATINIFGEIGWEVFASDVVAQIQNTKDDEINVIISSGGGSAFEGLMIYDALMAFKSDEKKVVNTKILGLGASAASVIFMAGDSREMGEGSLLMVHNSWSSFTGNKQEIIEQLGTLEAIDNRMLNIFQKGTGLRAEDLEDLLAQETWMTVEVAMSYNFANTVGETVSIAASLHNHYKAKRKKEEPVMATEEETEKAGFFEHMKAWFIKDEPQAKAEDSEDEESEEVEAKAEDHEEEEMKAEDSEESEEKAKAEDIEEEESEEMKAAKAKIEALENQLAEAKASADSEVKASVDAAKEKHDLILDAMSENKFTMHEAKSLYSESLEDVKAAIEKTAVNASGGGKTERPEETSIENKYDAWMDLKKAGKHDEAQAYYTENRNEILKDK